MRIGRGPLGTVLGLAVAAVACGGSENKVISQYFTAVNAKDNDTLSSFAAVRLDKKVDKWAITQASPESRTPAPLPDLVKKFKDAEAAVAENKKAAAGYSNEHYKEVDQVREILKKGGKMPANLSGVAAHWEEFNHKDRDLRKTLAEAKDALDKEKRVVLLSLGSQMEDVESMTGELASKDVDLSLTIGGQAQAYAMTLRKYDIAPASGPKPLSRWIIYSLAPKS